MEMVLLSARPTWWLEPVTINRDGSWEAGTPATRRGSETDSGRVGSLLCGMPPETSTHWRTPPLPRLLSSPFDGVPCHVEDIHRDRSPVRDGFVRRHRIRRLAPLRLPQSLWLLQRWLFDRMQYGLQRWWLQCRRLQCCAGRTALLGRLPAEWHLRSECCATAAG